jgi:predicted transcriptional regulator
MRYLRRQFLSAAPSELDTANTNFTTIRAYLDLLIRNGMIVTIDGSPVLYKTTEKGMAIIDRLKMLQEELAAIRQ